MPCSYYSPGEEASIRAQKASERANKYKKDLDRLGLEADKLEAVWEADPKKTLEPQLGFDPDEF